MTDEELSAIEVRANAATAGPWRPHWHDGCGGSTGDGCGPCAIAAGTGGCVEAVVELDCGLYASAADAEFIAAARTDVPALVAEVRKLRALMETLQWGSCDGCGNHWQCPLCTGRRPYDVTGVSYDDYGAPGTEGYGHVADCPLAGLLIPLNPHP